MPNAIRLADIVLRYRADAGTFVRDNNRAARSLRQVRTQAGNVARSFVGIAAAYVGVQQAFRGLGAAANFETSLARIQGLVGATDQQLRQYSSRLRELPGITGRSLNELAEGLFFIRSAGLEGEAAFGALEAAATASAAGLGETQQIADALTSAINTYGEANLSAADAAGILVATVTEGKLEAETLAPVLGQLLPLANALGVGFNDVGAALAVMSRGGLNAARASTALRGILQAILDPTQEAISAIGDYGTSFEELRRIAGEQGLLPALERVNDAVGGNQQAITQLFPNIEGLVGVLQLLGGEAETTARIFANLADAGVSNLQTAFEAVSETAEFRFRTAWGDLAVQFVEIGSQVLPRLADALESLAANMRTIVAVVGTLFALRFVLRIGSWATAVATLTANIGAKRVALLGLTRVLNLIPFLGIATLLGAWASRLVEVREASYEVIEAFEDVSDRARETLERLNTTNRAQLEALRAGAEVQLESLRRQLEDQNNNVSGLDDFGGSDTELIEASIARVQARIEDLTEGIEALHRQEAAAFGDMEFHIEEVRRAAEAAVELDPIEVIAEPEIRERDPASSRLVRQRQLYEGATRAVQDYNEQLAREARLLAHEQSVEGLEGPDLARANAEFEAVSSIIDDYRNQLVNVRDLETSIAEIRSEISEARLTGNTTELEALQSLLVAREDELQVAERVRAESSAALSSVNEIAQRAGDIAAAREELRQVTEEVETIGDVVAADVGRAFGDFTRDVLFAFDDIGDAAEELGRRIVAALIDALVVQQVVNAVTGFVGGIFSGGAGGGGGVLGSLFGTPISRQHGGYTPPGLALVGEVGPELVDFRSPSRVYSTDRLSEALAGQPGGTTINFAPVIQTSDGAAVEAALQRAFPDFEAAVRAGINIDARRTSGLRRAIRGR